jgi:hypothetical protein
MTGMQVCSDFYYYRGGVYTYEYGEALGTHAICVVGYSDIENCWICKNCWGTDWGEAGFFRIAYGQCGIDDTIQYVAYDPLDPAPVFRIKGGIYYLQSGHKVSLDISARSNRGAAIRYSAENLPAGARYDAESGLFSWTPDRGLTGSFVVVFSAADELNVSCSEFTFIVSDYFDV